MLRMISSGQLYTLPHMSVLHVQQEVAVLSSETGRESLLARERDL